MTASASTAVATPGTRNVMVMLLIRLAAVHVISIYAGIFTVIHWLRDVPVQESWIIGVVGFAMLFLAFGVMITGRALGFFSTQYHRISVDWLPLLLVWPLALSIWACFGLGLAGIQAKQHLANGLAMPLIVLAATVPPLLLGRTPPWPAQRRIWQKLLDGHYAVASLAAALTLFLAIESALEQNPSAVNGPQVTASDGTSPAPSPTSTVAAPASGASAASPGFACDRSKAATTTGDVEEDEDNQCPPPRGAAQPSVPATAAAAPPPPPVAIIVRPIDQNFSAWGGIWMVFSGVLLGLARLFVARCRAGASVVGAMAPTGDGGEAALSGLSAPNRQLAGQLMSVAQNQMAAQAGSWLRSSGVPGADLLADMAGRFLSPTSSTPRTPGLPVVPTPAPLAALETMIAAPPSESAPTPPVMVPPVPVPQPAQAPPPPAPDPTPAPVPLPKPVVPPPVPPPPTVAAPISAPPPTAVAPSPDDAETAALRARVKDMDSALAKQQDTANQLQSSVGTLQDKLEKQAQVMNQVMAESQRAAEESRRTIDSLTRLMQGMKGDLERLSRSHTE